MPDQANVPDRGCCQNYLHCHKHDIPLEDGLIPIHTLKTEDGDEQTCPGSYEEPMAPRGCCPCAAECHQISLELDHHGKIPSHLDVYLTKECPGSGAEPENIEKVLNYERLKFPCRVYHIAKCRLCNTFYRLDNGLIPIHYGDGFRCDGSEEKPDADTIEERWEPDI